jgi:uncharacterized protein (TIGR03118 family)
MVSKELLPLGAGRTSIPGRFKGESHMQFRTTIRTAGLALALLLASGVARAQYQVTNLVSNQEKTAKFVDPLVANAWGLVRGPATPFWVNDNGTGWSTLYDASGAKVALNVSIPTAGGDGPGTPTGIVFNGSTDFKIKGSPAIFIFATLDGTISGWNPAVNPDTAVIAVKTPGASYTGLANSTKASGNVLLAADNANNKVDIYDATFKLIKSVTDPTVPAGFAPYGIQDFGGLVYVTFAGPGNTVGGVVDIFAEDGTLLKQLASGSPLNQPWGLAIAPKNFGPLSNALLVGNNVSNGTINAFNSVTGQFIGTMKDVSGANVHIDQVWGIDFGGGTTANGETDHLFFTAGPDNYATGLFGEIIFEQPAP